MNACPPLSGTTVVPGDKSIGHRALMVSAIANGRSTILGLSEGQDNSATARILGQLGVSIDRDGDRTVVEGVGLHGFQKPNGPLDCGNSGTTMRLMLGLLAGQPFEVTLLGDESLSRRPMNRVLEPLGEMGLEILETQPGGLCPLRVRGQRPLEKMTYDSPIASAQVKSAILLAGLYANGDVSVREPGPSRDHTERMLAHVGTPPKACELRVPGDLSSAAFLIAAALLVPGSRVTIANVGVNPTRTGFLDVIRQMGAEITETNMRSFNGEPCADLTVAHSTLRGFTLGSELVVRSIDELPLLAVLASRANGTSHIRHASELRVKESDRIAKTVELLASFGVSGDEHPDGLTVHGRANSPLVAGRIDASGDHRIAMCAVLMSLIAPDGTIIDGLNALNSSFPTFFSSLESLGVPQDLLAGVRQSRK